jgi:biotin carboxylase
MLSKVSRTVVGRAALSRKAKALVKPLSAVAAKTPDHSNFAKEQRRYQTKISAPQAPPPFPICITYNQSKHATNSVLADIRAVWGNRIRVLQTVEEGGQRLPGMDGVIYIGSKMWGNTGHFKERLKYAATQDHHLDQHWKAGEVVFMPGWSAFAESAETARAVNELGLVWPGTEPVASDSLEKIGFKRICKDVGAPTPPFCVLSEEGFGADLTDPVAMEEVVQSFMKLVADMKTSEKGLIKSIHGGGGKGTAHLDKPDDPAEVRASVEKVLNEMGRSDGIYFEEKVNTKGDGRFYQIELEVDGETVANGGRFVWFNSRLQKVVEIGLSDPHLPLFMEPELYQKSRVWSAAVAKKAGNNTRATMEALVFRNEKGVQEIQFIECNRRPQVENEALALLQEDSNGDRRYTFAELMMRAKGYPAPDFADAKDINVVLHARWLHGNPDSDGNIAYQAGRVQGMSGPRLDFLASELLAPGEISFSSDPQLGKAVITAGSWPEMCDRAVRYFKERKPVIFGSSSTYAQTMINLFSNEKMKKGEIASNETFKYLEIPEHPRRSVLSILEEQVTPVLVKGYLLVRALRLRPTPQSGYNRRWSSFMLTLQGKCQLQHHSLVSPVANLRMRTTSRPCVTSWQRKEVAG